MLNYPKFKRETDIIYSKLPGQSKKKCQPGSITYYIARGYIPAPKMYDLQEWVICPPVCKYCPPKKKKSLPAAIRPIYC